MSYPIAISGLIDHVNDQVVNIVGDISTTVNELAQVTAEAWSGAEANVVHLDARNEVAHAESDHKKLNCFFIGLPKPIGLRIGMKNMVAWARETGRYFEPVEFDAVEIKRKLPASWLTNGLKEVPAFVHNVTHDIIEYELL